MNYQSLLGLTREQLIEVLGEPDLIAATTRKYKYPLIYRYGNIEYNFTREREGILVEVFDEYKHKTICRLQD